MLAPTHIVFGTALSLIVLAVFGLSSSLHWSIIFCAIIGSLLPDIDLPKSSIGKLVTPLSKAIEKRFGHRTITHSLLAWALVSVVFASFVFLFTFIFNTVTDTPIQNLNLQIRWISAFSIGYFSHLLLDMFNPSGVPLFWPNPTRDVALGNPKYRPRSGAKSEAFIFLGLCLVLVLALPLSEYGFKSSLRWMLATPDSAIKQLQGMSTHHYIDFSGTLSRDNISIAGRAEILGSARDTLTLYYKGTVYTLGDHHAADIVAERARVLSTETAIENKSFSFKNEPRDSLLAAIPDDYLLSGSIQLPKGLTLNLPVTSTVSTITQTGRTLKLNYASKTQLSQLELTKHYYLKQKKTQSKLRLLQKEFDRTTAALNTFAQNDGLTREGRALLQTQDESRAYTKKRRQLSETLEQLTFEIQEQQLILAEQQPVFSGSVNLRPVLAVPENKEWKDYINISVMGGKK